MDSTSAPKFLTPGMWDMDAWFCARRAIYSALRRRGPIEVAVLMLLRLDQISAALVLTPIKM